MDTPSLPEPQRKSCLERGFIVLVRLTFALLMGIAIGAGIYFGARLLYGQYLSLTQDYDARITSLEAQQTDTNNLISDRLSSFQTRLETLEIQGDSQKEALADLENQLATYEEYVSYQATVVAGQQITQQSIQDTLLSLQTEVSTLQSDLESLQSGMSDFSANIAALESTTEELAEAITENQTAINLTDELVQNREDGLTALRHQMVFLQAMELVTRARLTLVQGNTTLAQSDLEAAYNLLTKLKPDLNPNQGAYVEEITTVLSEISASLPDGLLTAADKLESVWQMLAAGLPGKDETNDSPMLVVTPTLTPAPEITPTPTP